jgi:hypothetical protein
LGLGTVLLADAIYKQNNDGKYSFNKDGTYKTVNINAVMDTIADFAGSMYSDLSKSVSFLNMCSVFIDYTALRQALYRYSRDIYGQIRFKQQIESLYPSIPAERTAYILSRMYDFGFKVNSFSPYFHRKLATLFYWFSVLKPFHIQLNGLDESEITETYDVINYFNEFTVYTLLKSCLSTCISEGHTYEIQLTIDAEDIFKEFLYDLHFRKLSRSSLEFFLSKYCILNKKKQSQ